MGVYLYSEAGGGCIWFSPLCSGKLPSSARQRTGGGDCFRTNTFHEQLFNEDPLDRFSASTVLSMIKMVKEQFQAGPRAVQPPPTPALHVIRGPTSVICDAVVTVLGHQFPTICILNTNHNHRKWLPDG